MSKAKSTCSIGLERVDITPPVGTTMVGYKPRISNDRSIPHYAEALYCSDGTTEWLLITADFIGIRAHATNRLRKKIEAKSGVPIDNISIAGTHTHSGPPIILADAEELTDLDNEYLDGLWDKLVDLAHRAKSSAEDGLFEVVTIEAPGFASNRRVQRENGEWDNEWRDPEGHHPGFVDTTLTIVKIVRTVASSKPDSSSGSGASVKHATSSGSGVNEEVAGVLVNFGCHPVTLGPESLSLSPDYPGYLKEYLRRTGTAKEAMFLLAGCGNINPRDCIHVGEEYPRDLGERIGKLVRENLAKTRPVDPGPVSTVRTKWVFERDRDSYKRAGLRGYCKGDPVETDVSVFRAGELSIVMIPGELFSEFNSVFRKASTSQTTLVATLANDYVGYIPTDLAQEQGAYETRMAPAVGLESMITSEVEKSYAALGKGGAS